MRTSNCSAARIDLQKHVVTEHLLNNPKPPSSSQRKLALHIAVETGLKPKARFTKFFAGCSAGYEPLKVTYPHVQAST